MHRTVQIRPGLKQHILSGKNGVTICGIKSDILTYPIFKNEQTTCLRCKKSLKKKLRRKTNVNRN